MQDMLNSRDAQIETLQRAIGFSIAELLKMDVGDEAAKKIGEIRKRLEDHKASIPRPGTKQKIPHAKTKKTKHR
eukprot:5070020-Lingulodinium_polyedra.AAC.1